MKNPFVEIDARLVNLEKLLLELRRQIPTIDTEKQPEKFLTVSEAAELLSISAPTIYSKTSKREIPFMKRGKRLYFSRADLLEYIKEGRRITHSEAKAASHSYIKQRNK